MTVDEIASFCEFKDCRVSVGNPEVGFIHVDGTGIEDRSYTYGRFNMLHEVSRLPSPRQVLQKATVFRIRRGGMARELSRPEFEAELLEFQRKVSL